MTVFATIAFAAFLLEYDHFLALYEGSKNFTFHFCTFNGRRTDFYIAVGIKEENLVESDCVALFCFLAEVVNLHSEALEFEAIHRVITETDAAKLMADMTAALKLTEGASGQSFTVLLDGAKKQYSVGAPTANLTVGSLQSFLDKWLSENAGKIDYIHGEDVVESLSSAKNSIGFLLPSMTKKELFPTVIKDGALPRKTFSMGHAHDKRFYCEARKIK